MHKKTLFLMLVVVWAFTGGTATLRADGYCGDGICQDQSCVAGGGSEACEEYSTCIQDCATGPGYCGDGFCGFSESCTWCFSDCGNCTGGGGGSCPSICSSDIECTSCQDRPYCIFAVCRGNV